jgi:Flp pilus assembly protein TadB
VEPVEPVYDSTGEPIELEPIDRRTEPQSRWARWRKERRDYIIKRKEAQAGIAKHRKWVIMWIAVIVVAIVILAIFVMNKMSLTGILF